MAIQAGAGVALEPADIPSAFVALKAAVQKGEISEKRLDESVRRLLSAKAWEGLGVHRFPDLMHVDKQVGSPAAQQESQEIVEHAMTLVKDDKNALPLKLNPSDDVLLLNFVDAGNAEFTGVPGRTFRSGFLKRHANTLFTQVTESTTRSEAELIKQIARRHRTVVVSCSIRIASYKQFTGLSDVQRDLLQTLSQRGGPFVFALFGSPYLLNTLPELPSYVLACEFYPGAETAMVRAIFGEIPFQGKLPTTVGNFPVGFSLKK
jgi:beta-N-acetylhexosaminidase